MEKLTLYVKSLFYSQWELREDARELYPFVKGGMYPLGAYRLPDELVRIFKKLSDYTGCEVYYSPKRDRIVFEVEDFEVIFGDEVIENLVWDLQVNLFH